MWEYKEIQEQIKMLDGDLAPTLVFQHATYLHGIYKEWRTGNIWIANDRIIYVGDAMPALLEGTEVVDATDYKLVPGYIEPHAHPFQLYNPVTFAEYAAQGGTTTFLSDNLKFFLGLSPAQAFDMLDAMKSMPVSFYWWSRFDSQTILSNEQELFTAETIAPWLERSDVWMGGELTSWPRLLAGDLTMFDMVTAAKAKGLKIEGHFPGASERTLAKMRLLGTDGDHEAMTIEEVENRLQQGYGVTLRYSSIRQDLPSLLRGIVDKGHRVLDHVMMTTDGSTPSFHREGVMDKCIQVALDSGVSPIDAYQMASYNIARYYDKSDIHGLIAPGRYATLNLLSDENNPVPTDVLSKGIWLKRHGQRATTFPTMDWSPIAPLAMAFQLTEDDFAVEHPVGIEMVNDVITKPYGIQSDRLATGELDEDESYLMLLDRQGKWRVTTYIKGFATSVQGFATSYSNTGDIILVGKNKADMRTAFEELKQMGGGMVLAEQESILARIPLTIGGVLSNESFEVLMEKEIALKQAFAKRGYQHGDAVYTFLFLQSTHLPYIRITPLGLYDVMKKQILVPVKERLGIT